MTNNQSFTLLTPFFSLSPSLIAIGPVRHCLLLFWILQRKHLTVWLSLLTSDSLSRELVIRLQKSGISEPVVVSRPSLATSPTSTLSSTYSLQLGTQGWFIWLTGLAGSGQGYFERWNKREMAQRNRKKRECRLRKREKMEDKKEIRAFCVHVTKSCFFSYVCYDIGSSQVVMHLPLDLTTHRADSLTCAQTGNWTSTHTTAYCAESLRSLSRSRDVSCSLDTTITTVMSGMSSEQNVVVFWWATRTVSVAWVLLAMVWPCVPEAGILPSRFVMKPCSFVCFVACPAILMLLWLFLSHGFWD